MQRRMRAGIAAMTMGLIVAAMPAFSQTQLPTAGSAVDGSPAWFLQGSFPDPGGRTRVDASGSVTVIPRGETGGYRTATGETPGCPRVAHLR